MSEQAIVPFFPFSLLCEPPEKLCCAAFRINRMTSISPSTSSIDITDVDVVRHGVSSRPETYDPSASLAAPVNQGLCGSCWSISTTQAFEDRLNRYRSRPVPTLSFQFVTDCARNCVTFEGRTGCALRCGGGFLVTAYRFLHEVGTVREEYHPNRHDAIDGENHLDGTASNDGGACPRVVDANEPMFKSQGYYNVMIYPDMFGITNARNRPLRRTPQQLKINADNIAEEIYQNGSVAVCFNLYSDFRDFWRHPNSKNIVYEIGWQVSASDRASIDPVGSVFWNRSTGPHGIYFVTGHSVSIVGFGRGPGTDGTVVDYWVCRNSWGRPNRTHNGGFFKIRRGINASAIEADVAAPKVDRHYAENLLSSLKETTLAPSTSIAPLETTCTTNVSWILIIGFLVLLAVGLGVYNA